MPELYALQSMIAGRFSEPALLVWSAVWFAALLIAAREALDAWNVRQDWARCVFVLLTLAIGVFAVGHLMAGSVDWIVAFALTAALPALVRPVCARRELQLGVLAALAAATKLEGHPARRAPDRRRAVAARVVGRRAPTAAIARRRRSSPARTRGDRGRRPG